MVLLSFRNQKKRKKREGLKRSTQDIFLGSFYDGDAKLLGIVPDLGSFFMGHWT